MTITVTAAGSDPVLQPGVAEAGSVAQGEWQYYVFNATSGAELIVDLFNLSGDVDLYVQNGTRPTLTSYACRPYIGGLQNESCTHQVSAGETWYVGVYGYNAGGYSIQATLLAPVALTSGQTVSDAVAQGEWDYFVIEASAADSQLVVDMTDLTADVDLYVRNGSRPTAQQFDCRPYKGGTTAETCTLPNSGATTWHIGIQGYEAGSYSINATLY